MYRYYYSLKFVILYAWLILWRCCLLNVVDLLLQTLNREVLDNRLLYVACDTLL